MDTEINVHDIEKLECEEVDLPHPESGQVRIFVCAISLNARDLMALKGPFGRIPNKDLVPGSDIAEVIDLVGSGVGGWTKGNPVDNLFFRNWQVGYHKSDIGSELGDMSENGVLTEYIVLPATRIARAPLSLNHAQAATLPCAGVTS